MAVLSEYWGNGTKKSNNVMIQDYRNKIEDLESAMQAVYPRNWYKIKWKYTKQHIDKLKAKAMVYQSEINECKIYISLLGG